MNRSNYLSPFLDGLKKKTGNKDFKGGNAGAVATSSPAQNIPRHKQYGDRGYKPSTGIVVGY